MLCARSIDTYLVMLGLNDPMNDELTTRNEPSRDGLRMNRLSCNSALGTKGLDIHC